MPGPARAAHLETPAGCDQPSGVFRFAFLRVVQAAEPEAGGRIAGERADGRPAPRLRRRPGLFGPDRLGRRAHSAARLVSAVGKVRDSLR
jgi:hypothetical protein